MSKIGIDTFGKPENKRHLVKVSISATPLFLYKSGMHLDKFLGISTKKTLITKRIASSMVWMDHRLKICTFNRNLKDVAEASQ